MKNNNQDAMKNYFDAMLNDGQQAEDKTQLDYAEAEDQLPLAIAEKLIVASQQIEVEQVVTENLNIDDNNQDEWQNLQVEEQFQVLFFEVNQVTFAIPLTDLGGIHPLDISLNFITGKPHWFSGVMRRNQNLYNIVDSAAWLQLACNKSDLNYSHFVLLGNSVWGLSCEKLLGTDIINKNQVKWRETKGARPWLAGMVKDKMCVLIHTQELIKLLNQGLDIKG